jgi:hypothetical protein
MAKNTVKKTIKKEPRFKWDEDRSMVAIYLADGYTIAKTSEMTGVPMRTIARWKSRLEFAAEVDRLSLIAGIANRAERLRVAKRIMRQLEENKTPTQKDLLDWMKYVQSETDGIKLDIASLIEDATSMAGSGSEGSNTEKEPKK